MPQRPCHLGFLLLAWLIGSASGMVFLGLAACSVGPASDLQIDWVDVVQLNGITYLADTAQAWYATPAEVGSMGALRWRVLPAWTGFVLVAVGFPAFVASYFLLPLYVRDCFDSCTAQTSHAAMWEFSLNALSHWEYWANALPHVDISLVPYSLILALCYLPLLAAVTVVGCSVGFLIRPHRRLAIWSNRAWLAGGIALGTMLFLGIALPIFGFWPDAGYFGMLVGYGLLWAGNRIFLAALS